VVIVDLGSMKGLETTKNVDPWGTLYYSGSVKNSPNNKELKEVK
jgi:hypothetical protein